LRKIHFHYILASPTVKESPMNLPSSSSVSLAELKAGEHATFVEFDAGRQMVGRLISLGFTPGARLEMTQNHGHGPLLVSVRGSFVALGRGEANHILVQRRKA
jgi:ferrous iron transport protein A